MNRLLIKNIIILSTYTYLVQNVKQFICGVQKHQYKFIVKSASEKGSRIWDDPLSNKSKFTSQTQIKPRPGIHQAQVGKNFKSLSLCLKAVPVPATTSQLFWQIHQN